MNRSSMSILAKILAEKNSMTISEAEAFIKQMFDVANGVMQADKQLKIRWLGTFKVTSVKDRESVDVNTGERIVIGGRDKITFTPDNILKEIVNKPFAQFETVVVNDGVDFSEIDRKFSFDSKEDVSIPSDEQQPSDELENSPIEKLENSPIEKLESIPAVTVQSAEPVVQENETPTEEVPVHVENLNVLPEEEACTEEHESVLPVEEKQREEPISEVQEAEQSVKEEEPEQVVETSSVQEEISESTPEVTDLVSQPKQTTPAAESYFEDKDADNADEVDEVDDVLVSDKKHYFMLPRYVISVAVVLIIVLIGGVGWFAFNYGKMQAQRNHLAMQLEEMQKTRLKKDSLARLQKDDLRMKALQDSARLAQAAEVVNSVDEHQTEAQVDSIKKAEAKKAEVKAKAQEVAKEKEAAKMKEKALTESKYDVDPRVRTGAYRITGIDQTVVAKSGQTLSSISKLYLGPGMECYLEAVNGGAIDVKAGQKIKIPKLVLKKKK